MNGKMQDVKFNGQEEELKDGRVKERSEVKRNCLTSPEASAPLVITVSLAIPARVAPAELAPFFSFLGLGNTEISIIIICAQTSEFRYVGDMYTRCCVRNGCCMFK